MFDDDKRQIELEASEWVIRLGGRPLDAGERLAFDRWLARSAQHRQMFERARSLWGDLGQLGGGAPPVADIATRRPAGGRAGRSWKPAAALAASLLLLLGLGGAWFGNPVPTLLADYRTSPAELRIVNLPDGSTAEIGPASAIALHFSTTERRIELLAGVVHVSVVPKAKAGGRPFRVEAANGVAEALGTRFTVERLPDSVKVTVAEHEVRVSATVASTGAGPGGENRAAVLSPGQSIRYDARQGMGTVVATDLDNANAWLRGRLVFDRVPLSDAVAVLNRYRRGRILILDTELAERSVSGVFDTADIDNALSSITRALDVKAMSVPPFVTVLH